MRYLMIAVTALLNVVCVAVSTPAQVSVCTDPQWRSLLNLGERNNDTAARQLSEYAARSEDTPATLLARHLLATRKSPEGKRAAAEPQLLAPLRFEPKAASGRTVAGVVVVAVTVDQNGCVTDAMVVRKHQDSSVTQQAREFIANTLFVPAMKDGIYVPGRTTVVAPIHVR